MMEYDFKKHNKYNIKPSLKYLNFSGWMKIIPNFLCMITICLILGLLLSLVTASFLLKTNIVSPDASGLWGFLILALWAIICGIVMYYTMCRKCNECKIKELCQHRLDEENKKLHTSYVNSQKENIKTIRDKILDLRHHIDVLSTFGKTDLINDEIQRTLKQIASYEDIANQFEDDIEKEK